ESHVVRQSGRYPLCGRGDVNTYSLFAELNRSLMGPTGRVGCIVPSGIATDDTTKDFFQDLMNVDSLVSLFEFENEGFFLGAGQGHMNRFCLLTLSGPGGATGDPRFMFRGVSVEEIGDPARCFTLSATELRHLNPNTLTCPVFRFQK